MTELEKAARMALEALEDYKRSDDDRVSIAMHTLRRALEQPASGIKQVIELYDSPEQPAQQQEPVAWILKCGEQQELWWEKPPFGDAFPLYTRPQAREPLTMIEMVDAAMAATRTIYPPITRSQCETIIKAAAYGIGEKK